jgi:hypothetical protein
VVSSLRINCGNIRLAGRFEDEQIFWRGHCDESWALTPAVFRLIDGKPHNETELLWSFRTRAPTRHPHCPHRDALPDWMVFAQHYGLPTRLLDWSMSPLIALFFAVMESKHDGRDGCLWALSPSRLNGSAGIDGLASLSHHLIAPIIQHAFVSQNLLEPNVVIAIDTYEIDQRMLVQQAKFTLHSTAADASIENRSCFMGFKIPSKAKAHIRQLLKFLGITRSTLFPDLHNLALEATGNSD